MVEHRTSDDLLPCPFCGGQADPKGWMAGDGRTGPACDDCGGSADTFDLWNTRIPVRKHYALVSYSYGGGCCSGQARRGSGRDQPPKTCEHGAPIKWLVD